MTTATAEPTARLRAANQERSKRLRTAVLIPAKMNPVDGARERFQDLIVPEISFLARVSRAMSRSSADAEDLAQETLVKAFRAMDGFDGQHPRAWLFRIARNTAINRDRRNHELLLDDDSLLDQGDMDDSPEQIVLAPIVDEHLQHALDDLSPAFRLVVQLVDVEGMRYQEAADLIGVPVGTVMSRLHRARRQLRRAIAGTSLDRTT